MGNNPSSHLHPHHSQSNHPTHHHHHQSQQSQSHHQSNRSHPTNSAPPTPTGVFHSSHNQLIHSSSFIPSHSNSLNNHQTSFAPPLPPIHSTFVDGGYLLPLSNLYPSFPQDWLHPIVQHLILSRRLAPFYRGLEDWNSNWLQPQINQALTTITQTRIHSVKKILESLSINSKSNSSSISKRFSSKPPFFDQSISHSNSSDNSNLSSQRQKVFDAILNWPIRSNEADWYLHTTVECPICFLYYPSNINLSRCCQQPICTECFVHIKRNDPTPQELKSDPACCPYCVESNFGVTYEPPPANKQTDWQPNQSSSNIRPLPLSNQPTSNVQSTINPQSAPNNESLNDSNHHALEPSSVIESEIRTAKRRHTTSHTSQEVVTTDSIQPDWQTKLETVKATVQRRANRRIIFRQEGDRLIPVGITSSRDPSGSAFFAAIEAEQSSSSGSLNSRRGLGNLLGSHSHGNSTTASSSSRRHRPGQHSNHGVDLEEFMIMEAMRLSLAEEEERKRKLAQEEERNRKAADEEEEQIKRLTEAISDSCDNRQQDNTAQNLSVDKTCHNPKSNLVSSINLHQELSLVQSTSNNTLLHSSPPDNLDIHNLIQDNLENNQTSELEIQKRHEE
ncbi:hypothetical protein O181_083298 [Austropuccinia psidii MF-1]|uniref:RING-type domain-containing protein n=1 Tax=Austropuccinia psidii MF-1 TaxID=1389203 RepID=A0A9Q3FTE4_9BASI|nr:hypothetical protein [Austropuccinia psidii MF-1]